MMKRNDTTHSNSLPEVEITNTCISFVANDSKIEDKSIQKSTHIAPDDTVITEEKSVT